MSKALQKRLSKRNLRQDQLKSMEHMIVTERALEQVEHLHTKRAAHQATMERRSNLSRQKTQDRLAERQRKRSKSKTAVKPESERSATRPRGLGRLRLGLWGRNKKIIRRLTSVRSLAAPANSEPQEIPVRFWGGDTGVRLAARPDSVGLMVVGISHNRCPSEGRKLLRFGDRLHTVEGLRVLDMPHAKALSKWKEELSRESGHSVSEEPPSWTAIFFRAGSTS